LAIVPWVHPLIRLVPACPRPKPFHDAGHGEVVDPSGTQPVAKFIRAIAAPVDGPGQDLLPVTDHEEVTG